MKAGEYVRNCYGRIAKIEYIEDNIAYCDNWLTQQYEDHIDFINLKDEEDLDEIIKSSPNIIDLVEYMDLLWLEHPIKLYDITIGLFNPVRCDGFTTFEDGTHCIILNMDYIVDIKDLKIKGIITHEQIESMEYKVKE